MTDLSTRIQQLYERITIASSARPDIKDKVSLLAVSKTRTSEDIRKVFGHGISTYGENYVQEGVEKVKQLQDLDIEWHFIGPLQSNKTKAVAEHFDWVHTIDRKKIATRLNEHRPIDREPLNVLIQINISAEDTKSGISLIELPELAEYINQLPHLTLRGLMCIPSASNAANINGDFRDMRKAFERMQNQFNQVDTLSMGMSQDLEQAIENGATTIRIGTALFGPRDYSNQ